MSLLSAFMLAWVLVVAAFLLWFAMKYPTRLRRQQRAARPYIHLVRMEDNDSALYRDFRSESELGR